MVINCYTFSFITTFYLTKTEKQNEKISNSCHTIALNRGTIFAKKADFLKKMLISAKFEIWSNSSLIYVKHFEHIFGSMLETGN